MTTPVPAEFVEFRAAFEGPAVDAGHISARQFASSLFAVTELIEQAAAEEFRQENAVAIEVRADFRRSSFDFGLLAGPIIPTVQHAFAVLTVADLNGLLRHLGFLKGFAGKSLLGIIKRFGQRPVTEIRQEGDGNVALVFNFGDNAEILTGVPKQVLELLQSERVRAVVPDVVKPLLAEGIERLRIGPKRDPDLVIAKDDVPQFDAPPSRVAQLTDSVAETGLELLSPDFVEGRVWRVAQGGTPFNVRIADDGFLRRVDGGETFSKGDYLIVEMRTKTFATSRGLRPEREVVRVLQHLRRGNSQGNLFTPAE